MSLPSPELVNYYRLAENRIFYIDYEIDESVLEVQKAIIYYNIIDKDIPVSERKPIIILLDTPWWITCGNIFIGSNNGYVKNKSDYGKYWYCLFWRCITFTCMTRKIYSKIFKSYDSFWKYIWWRRHI
jgi:hypothetical protein